MNVLPEIDPTILLEVVRRSQNNATFEILNSTANVLSVRGAANSGIWHISGLGRVSQEQFVKPWSVVLKIYKKPDQLGRLDSMWYWKREFIVNDTGFLERLPGPIRPPQCFGTTEFADSVWIWMELISDISPESWGLDQFAFAAHELGRFNGAMSCGLASLNFEWMARNHTRTWTSLFQLTPHIFENPHVKQVVSTSMQRSVLKLAEEYDSFLAILDQPPQLFSHFDYKRSNLFIRKNNENKNEIVAVDWGDCGTGVLGGDLTRLVGASTYFQGWDAHRVAELDATAFAAYIDGLHKAGWHGEPERVRLAYTASFALDWGLTLPGSVALSNASENHTFVTNLMGCEPEKFTPNMVVLGEYALTLADEARGLMRRLSN